MGKRKAEEELVREQLEKHSQEEDSKQEFLGTEEKLDDQLKIN